MFVNYAVVLEACREHVPAYYQDVNPANIYCTIKAWYPLGASIVLDYDVVSTWAEAIHYRTSLKLTKRR